MASRGVAIIASQRTKIVVVGQISHDADNAGRYFREAFEKYGTGYTQSDYIDQVNDLFAADTDNRFRNDGAEFVYEPVVFGTSAGAKAEMQTYVNRLATPPGWNVEGTWKVDVVKGTVTKVGGSARRSKRAAKTPGCTCRRK
jgi:hypothetical protein